MHVTHLTTEQFRAVKAVYGLTNTAMGDLLGVSAAQVSYIVNGKRRLTNRLALRLIGALELTQAKMHRIMASYTEFGDTTQINANRRNLFRLNTQNVGVTRC